MKKVLIAIVTSCWVAALLVPTMAFASGGNSNQPRFYIGTVCSYTAGSSVTISQSCGGAGDVTVGLHPHTFIDYEGKTSPAPAPAAGDAAAAFVWYHKGAPIAWKLEYSESPFAFARALVPGTYISSTGDCSSGTLSIEGLGSQAKEHTFITDGNTAYENSGVASTCSAVTGAYAANQPEVVWATESTTGNWSAVRVNANPAGSHRNPFNDEHVVFGIICSYTAGQGAVISQNCGSTDDVAVSFDKGTWLVYKGSTSPAPEPVVGDSAAAYLRWDNGFSTVGEFAYSEDAFSFARGLFAGAYVSSTGNCTSGSLTVRDLGSSKQTTFVTDLNSIYEDRGVASTCAAVSGGYTAGERFIVLANESTDGSWYAVRINAHPVLSHRHPGRNLRVLIGTVCNYVAGKSVTVSQDCGSPSDITVKLGAHAKLVYEGSTTPVPAPAIGDSAAAFLAWHKGSPSVWKLEYSEDTFSFGKARFFGKYVSSDGTCSSGDLTIHAIGKKAVQTMFSADAYTVYLNDNRASTCAAVTAAYASGETLRVDANALTNNTWYATKIDANPFHK